MFSMGSYKVNEYLDYMLKYETYAITIVDENLSARVMQPHLIKNFKASDYFDVPNWVARLVCISLVIFTFQIAIIGYIAAIFLLDKRSDHEEERLISGNRKVFNYNKPASTRLKEIRERLARLNKQVQTMESYVTSKQYQTRNELNDL